MSQTTQSEDFFIKVAEYIRRKFPKSEIIFTICHSTHERQEEVKELAKKSGAVIVIGSKTSANSTRLFEIARSFNQKSYFIEKSQELSRAWFSGVKKVAVTAGASTPDWIIEKVLEKINIFGR